MTPTPTGRTDDETSGEGPWWLVVWMPISGRTRRYRFSDEAGRIAFRIVAESHGISVLEEGHDQSA